MENIPFAAWPHSNETIYQQSRKTKAHQIYKFFLESALLHHRDVIGVGEI